MFAQRAPGTLPFYSLSQLQPQIYPLMEAPQVDQVGLHTFLQSTLHNKAIAVNSTTPNVICIVLNKQHWSHTWGGKYIQYNSAPYTHHKL